MPSTSTTSGRRALLATGAALLAAPPAAGAAVPTAAPLAHPAVPIALAHRLARPAVGICAAMTEVQADAGLLDLVQQWHAVSAEIAAEREAEEALPSADPRRNGHFAAACALAERRRGVQAAIAALPARSVAGRRAKAEILMTLAEDRDDPAWLLAASVCRDLVGGAA